MVLAIVNKRTTSIDFDNYTWLPSVGERLLIKVVSSANSGMSNDDFLRMDFILDTTCLKVLTAWVMAADGSGGVREDASQGRVSVIAVSLLRYNGYRVLPFLILGLGIWVVSSVVSDNDVNWILTSVLGYGAAPPASGLAVKSSSCPFFPPSPRS